MQIRLLLTAAKHRLPELIAAIVMTMLAVVVGWPIAGAAAVDDYAAAILPTFIGVIAGIPFALWLVRVGDQLSAERAAAQARERRRTVLRVIAEELGDNLVELRGDRAERPRPLIIPFLKTEAWRSLADGGELRWVDDPELIGRLARAYHRIETVTVLERRIFEYSHHPVSAGVTFLAAGDPIERIRAWLTEQDDHAIAAIDHALTGLRDEQVTPPPV